MTTNKIVELDSRGRVSLGRFLPKDQRFQFYLIEVAADGSIALTPAMAVPASAIPR